MEVERHSFPNLGIWRQVVNFKPRLFYPWKEHRWPMNRRMIVPLDFSENIKISAPTGIRNPCRPYSSRYADYAIPYRVCFLCGGNWLPLRWSRLPKIMKYSLQLRHRCRHSPIKSRGLCRSPVLHRDPMLQNKQDHKYLLETSHQQEKWLLIAILSETNKSEGKWLMSFILPNFCSHFFSDNLQ